MSDNVTNDENVKKTVGFKVSPSEYAVLQQYAQLFHNQMIEDPNTKQPRRLLERPEIDLLIRNATYGYLVQYQYMMQAQAQQAKQQQVQAQQQEQIKINKAWETLAELKTPESVVYAPKQDTLFVSNIDGKPDQKDQKGFISKISLSNGSITELNWITGLDAPKGMAI